MGGLSFTGNTTHDNNVRSAEGTRQSAVAAATTQAAVNTAELAYWRTRRASALTNRLTAEAANAQQALMQLGTNGTEGREMATAAELTFARAVMAAEGVRQVAKAAAFATFSAAGFTPAAYATYAAALTTADVAFTTSVNSAATTLSLAGYTTPNSGPSQAIVEPGGIGQGVTSPNASIGGGTATMGSIC